MHCNCNSAGSDAEGNLHSGGLFGSCAVVLHWSGSKHSSRAGDYTQQVRRVQENSVSVQCM